MPKHLLLASSLLTVVGWAQMLPLTAPAALNDAMAACAAVASPDHPYRLPTVDELFSYALTRPGGPVRIGWTMTPLAGSAGQYFAVSMSTLDTNTYPDTERMDVVCTDAPLAAKPADRYLRHDGYIEDKTTRLAWETKTEQTKRQRYNYADAKRYCDELSVGTLSGWRLPTLAELYGMTDHSRVSPAADPAVFGDTVFKYYWSADTTPDPFANEAYVVGFRIGSVAAGSKINESFVRCVRPLP